MEPVGDDLDQGRRKKLDYDDDHVDDVVDVNDVVDVDDGNDHYLPSPHDQPCWFFFALLRPSTTAEIIVPVII